VSWFPILLVIHVALAVALLAPSVTLPFLLRRGGGPPETAGTLTRLLIALQGTGSLSEPWMLLALGLYAANLLVAAFISRPNLRRLVGIGQSANDDAWRRRARQQRYVAYGMAAAVGVIGLLMSTKPELW
jgi:hypothetical protein